MIALALLGAAAGAIVGSYIATLVLRWERGESASMGRSRCDACGRTLGPLDLIPVVSFALQRGRCPTCGGAIDRLHPTVELLAALVGFVPFLLLAPVAASTCALFGWLLLPGVLLDWRNQWLPDRITLLVALAGMGAGRVLGLSILDQLMGGAIGYSALAGIALAYRGLRGREGLGRGDPKLFGAIGLWLGWQWLAPVLLAASAAGLAVAIGRNLRPSDRMPFGTLLGIAAWLVELAALRFA